MEEGFERDLGAYQCAMVKRGFFLPDFYRPFFYGQPTESGIVYPSLPNKDGDRLEWRASLNLPANLTAYDFKNPVEKICRALE